MPVRVLAASEGWNCARRGDFARRVRRASVGADADQAGDSPHPLALV